MLRWLVPWKWQCYTAVMLKMVVVLFYSVFVLFAHVAETSQTICLLPDNIVLESCCAGDDTSPLTPADESKDTSEKGPCLNCQFCQAPAYPSVIHPNHASVIALVDHGYLQMMPDQFIPNDCMRSLLRPPRA